MSKIHSIIFAVAGSLFATSASAQMFETMPSKDPNWKPEFALAITTGQFDPKTSGSETESSIGIQLSLNCPILKPASGIIRQQFNYERVNGSGYDVSSLEANPRWYAVEGNLRYGAGPGFGYMSVSPNAASSESTFTLQLGAAIEYRLDSITIGADSRYMYTMDQDMFGSGDGMDNTLTKVSVGFNF